jgi:molybdenum cofactor guanylyltransferase
MRPKTPSPVVAGVLLAGGQSRRMGGGDKTLRPLGDRPILAHVIERARPQVAALALNANGDPARFRAFGLPVIADSVADFAGPLAGILAGLDWLAEAMPVATHLASFATDAPFLPRDLVVRLVAGLENGGFDVACAASAGRAHPVFALWPLSLRDALRHALCAKDIRKVDRFTANYRLATVEFTSVPVDPFFNANRPEDLEMAERLLINAG